MKKVICLMAGLLLMTSCNKTEEVNESKGYKKNVILDPVRVKILDPVRVKDKDNYPLYNRSLDTIQIRYNVYQVNAIYVGCSGIAVVKIRTFNK